MLRKCAYGREQTWTAPWEAAGPFHSATTMSRTYVTSTLVSWSTAQGNLLPCSTLLIHIRVSDSCTLHCDLTCVTYSTGSARHFVLVFIILLLSAKSFLRRRKIILTTVVGALHRYWHTDKKFLQK